jgi:hypothetical protein
MDEVVEVDENFDVLPRTTTPFEEVVITQDEIFDEVQPGELVWFDYTTKSGETRLRVGTVMDVKLDRIVIYDFNRKEPRGSRYDGIGLLTILEEP